MSEKCEGILNCEFMIAFGLFRQEIRQILSENNIKSNPASSDEDIINSLRKISKQNSELQAKVSELEDALRLNKAEQDVYSEAIREFDVIDKKNQVMRAALEKYADESNFGRGNHSWLVNHGWELAQKALKQTQESK